jgi:RNA polymerase sigma-70 factor (ECF subfamily)
MNETVLNDAGYCSELATQVAGGNAAAISELYALFQGPIKYHLCHQIGVQDAEDRVHDLFVLIVGQIQRGDLREPEKLLGYVWAIVRHQAVHWIRHAQRQRIGESAFLPDRPDSQPDPEACLSQKERAEIVLKCLRAMPARDQQILSLSYLREKSAEEICVDLGLNYGQFRNVKSRALGHLTKMVRAIQQPRHAIRPRITRGVCA